MSDKESLRISKTEYSPKIGPEEQKLKAVVPVFGEKLVESLVDALQNGAKSAKLTIRSTGENPYELILELRKEDGEKDLIIELSGDWSKTGEILRGSQIIADFDGVFWRKKRPEDKEPIVNEGDHIAPEGSIGIAEKGKMFWIYRIPKEEFPNGAEVVKFLIEDNAQVEKGKTVIGYFEKIDAKRDFS